MSDERQEQSCAPFAFDCDAKPLSGAEAVEMARRLLPGSPPRFSIGVSLPGDDGGATSWRR